MTREEALATTARKYMRLYREKDVGYEPSVDDCAICRFSGYPASRPQLCFAYRACCRFSEMVWGDSEKLKAFLWAARWCVGQMEGTKYYATEKE